MLIRITDIQRFCIHDGPGIRTTVFFQGCPLRCVWCQNPECQTAERRLRFAISRCIGCRACADACPKGAHAVSDGAHDLDRIRCEVCGRCVDACPTGALGLAGEEQTPESIMDVVRRDRAFYDASGGGVTLSGGEPLAQPEGARALLRLAREEGLHTAVETCGCVAWETIDSAMALVSLWLYDVKQFDADVHRAMTGRGNETILSNLERLLAAGAEAIVRVPVVPGYNDGEGLIAGMERWLRAHPEVREVHLMPYNRLAESKYASLGLEYALTGMAAPTVEEMDAAEARLAGVGVRVRIGG